MGFKQKHLLGIADLSKSEIEFILNTAESFKEVSERDIKKVPTLRGKTVINFFHIYQLCKFYRNYISTSN